MMARTLFLGFLVVLGLSPLSGQAPLPKAEEPLPGSAKAAQATPQEMEVVREMMKIRMFPKAYAKYIRVLGTHFRGKRWLLQNHVPIRTQEGLPALKEAVAFLEQVEPVKEQIAFSQGLHLSARDHVLDQGPSGQTGHVGEDGSSPRQRILRYGTPESLTGEVINYGEETPRMTVIQLVIDDGVPGRGHRKNIFNPAFRAAGAAIGYHKEYGSMTVVDLADAFTENK